MKELRTGEIMTEQFIEWGIDHIYGLPGDSINEFIDDLRTKDDEIRFIQVRHEEVGALSASAYAKLTGKIGACLSITGPGAIHLLNGLYDAKQDGAPVLAIVGQVTSSMVGTDAFQEVNLERVFDDVAVFNRRAESAKQLPDLLNKAIRSAYTENGVSVLIVPDDLFAVKHKKDEFITAPTYIKPQYEPDQESVLETVDLINQAEKPIILAGRGARESRKELIDFAEKIKAPIVLSLLGKGTIPDYHELNLGQHGQIGTKPAYEAIMDTDLLLLIGTSFPYREYLPDKTKAIQIDLKSQKIGSLYPITAGLCGDVKKILPSLTLKVKENENGSYLEKYQEKMKKWHINMIKEKKEAGNPIQAPQLMYALEQEVENDAVISCDVGNVTVWTTRFFPFTNQQFIISGRLASMGIGLPGAIAGQIANPNKQVVAICGDGGFSMVMHDFVTAVKYDLPIKVIILNNSHLAMIKYEQQEMGKLNYKTGLGEMDFAKFAESCGGEGYHIEKSEDLSSNIQKALQSDRPAVIDIAIEDMAPLPGKIHFDQAVKYSEYLLKEFFTNKKVEFPDIKKSLKRL
ncbi:pyruvate oxidase [Virgibacillus siamensis]|uniref:pyruvate oxidase n=1 Tax=Virgibacillus siamensis TaxID=480071 RepID=UPI000984D6A3|nr:pyruvate oxidase [Virgibacillus siamensis]